MNPMDTNLFWRQLEDAEIQARIDHDNGRCHLSQWSCSHCEAQRREAQR